MASGKAVAMGVRGAMHPGRGYSYGVFATGSRKSLALVVAAALAVGLALAPSSETPLAGAARAAQVVEPQPAEPQAVEPQKAVSSGAAERAGQADAHDVLPAETASLRSAIVGPRTATPAVARTGSDADEATQHVSSAGVSIDVPAAWTVENVNDSPGCVRYDRHAVYLGSPSVSNCPAHLVGRTTTVQIFGPAAGPDLAAIATMAAHTASARLESDHPQAVLGDSGDDLVVVDDGAVRAMVTIDDARPTQASTVASTIVIGGESVHLSSVAKLAIAQKQDAADTETASETRSDHGQAPVNAPAAQRDANANAQNTATARTASYLTAKPASSTITPQNAPHPQTTGARPSAVAQTFPDMAFDTCTTPSVDAMKAWLDSSYRKVGIYIGGVNASCKPGTKKNPNLSKDWVTQVTKMGWTLIPIFVGLQAPGATCCGAQISTKLTQAAKQGQQAAAKAAAQMAKFGLGPGNPIYLDMEAWNTTKATTNKAVMAFTDAWTKALHEVNYVSGFYTSAISLKVLVARAQSDSAFHTPDAIWFARWYRQWPTSKEKKQGKTRAGMIAEAHIQAQQKVNRGGGIVDTVIPDDLWPGQQRGWQYLGGHTVTHQGYKINIDSSWFYGPTAPVGSNAITIRQKDLPDIGYNAAYRVRLTSSGGGGHYVYSATAGSLPPGITLSPNGTLRGTTSQIGVWSFTVFVTDPSKSHAFGAQTYRIVSQFPDVTSANTFAGDITWLANNKITAGYKDGKFRPRAMITRGQMAAYLYRYEHPAAPKAAACTDDAFIDVPADAQFCGAIRWLANTGITEGYPDGRFKPGKRIFRGEMAAFLYRLQHDGDSVNGGQVAASSACVSSLLDVAADDTFCQDIVWLSHSGITTGYQDHKFHPGDTVSRQAMAAFLHRMAQKFGYVGPGELVSV